MCLVRSVERGGVPRAALARKPSASGDLAVVLSQSMARIFCYPNVGEGSAGSIRKNINPPHDDIPISPYKCNPHKGSVW